MEEEPDITVVSATVPATQPAASDDRIGEPARPWLRPVWLGIAASIPLIVGAVVDAINGWLPTGDDATIVLRARDVLSGHMPLVGQYSELSIYTHQSTFSPGPMLYWVLTIPAQTTRWLPAAPLVWMALVQSVVVIAIVSLADRLGGRVLAVGSAIGIVVLAGSVGPRILYEPWSAYAPILPLVLLVFLTAAIITGRQRLLPLVVLVASFEVQADPSFVVVTGLLSLLALCACLVAWRRARAVDWLTFGLTGAVAVASWLPAVVQQLTNSPGNLTLLWRGAHLEGQREGAGFGLTILAKAVVVWPLNRWVGIPLQGGSHVKATWIIGGLLVLAVLAALVVWAIRVGASDVTAMAITALVLAIAVTVAAATIPDDYLGRTSSWLLAWTRAAGMVLWVVVVWSAWRLWGQRFSIAWLGSAGAALLATGALVVAMFGRTTDPGRWAYPVIRRTVAAIESRPGRGPYAVSAVMTPYVPLMIGQGLIERLDARGDHVGASNGFQHNLGMHYGLPRDTPDVLVTTDPGPHGSHTAAPLFAETLLQMPVSLWNHGRQVVVRVSLREPS